VAASMAPMSAVRSPCCSRRWRPSDVEPKWSKKNYRHTSETYSCCGVYFTNSNVTQFLGCTILCL